MANSAIISDFVGNQEKAEAVLALARSTIHSGFASQFGLLLMIRTIFGVYSGVYLLVASTRVDGMSSPKPSCPATGDRRRDGVAISHALRPTHTFIYASKYIRTKYACK